MDEDQTLSLESRGRTRFEFDERDAASDGVGSSLRGQCAISDNFLFCARPARARLSEAMVKPAAEYDPQTQLSFLIGPFGEFVCGLASSGTNPAGIRQHD